MSEPEQILSFWFEQPATDAETLKRKVHRWYAGGPDVDREIASRFREDVERAERGELSAWGAAPRSGLAAILVMDQFTRNIYRADPRAFALDPTAQRASLAGLAAGFERELSLEERLFLYMPLVHAEDRTLQERAVSCVGSLVSEAPSPLRAVYELSAESARQHRDTIVRFGRFPARNAALGRVSTPEELSFLESAKNASRAP
jgi:uncharacterized protein (DUF924 family)